MDIEKRKRINRIKKIIILFIISVILILFGLCGFLLFQNIRLKKELANANMMIESQAKAMTQQYMAIDPAVMEIGEGGMIITGELEEPEVAENSEISVFDYDALLSQEDMEDTDPYLIYLTFDDGPSDNTEKILTILREYNVKATFFVNGREDEDSIELYKRIVDAGHTLGMHSYSHNYNGLYSSEEAFEADFNRLRELLVKSTGVEPVYYRFPGGSSNSAATKEEMAGYVEFLHREGTEYVDWNIDPGDAKEQNLTSDDIINNVFRNFGKYHTNVVLLHDGFGHGVTVDALPGIIERARNMGAQLLPITEETVPIQHR